MNYKDPEYKKQYQAEWYQKNKELQKSRAMKHTTLYKARNRKIVEDFKADKPCIDCGELFPPYVMDFDHINDDKVNCVSRLAGLAVSVKTLKDEIDKCELVCSNCHRVRTHNRAKAL